jgi:hypothetical protein
MFSKLLDRFDASVGGGSSSSRTLTPLNLLFCLLLLAPSFVWIALDRHVWPWDQACYGAASTDLWFILTHHPERYLFSLACQINHSRPPGIALLGQFFVPVGLLFHSVEFGLLLSILTVQLVNLLLLFDIGRSLAPKNKLAPYLACLVLAATPLFTYLSHEYFVEPLQLLSVLYFYWLFLRRETMSVTSGLAHLTLASTAALLAKASTPLYCCVPAALCAISFLRRFRAHGLSGNRTEGVLLLLGLFSLASTISWYLRNLHKIWIVVRDASFGTMGLHYGHQAGLFAKLGLWWDILLRSALLPPFAWIIGLSLLFLVCLNLRKATLSKIRPDGIDRTVIAVCLTQVGLILAIFSLNIGEDSRYIFALYPSLLIPALVLFREVNTPSWTTVFTGALACQYVFLNSTLFFSDNLVIQSLNKTGAALQHDDTRMFEVTRIVDLASDYTLHHYLIFCGCNYSWINPWTLDFYSAKQQCLGRPRARFEYWPVQASVSQIVPYLVNLPQFVFITLDTKHQKLEPDVLFANQFDEGVAHQVKEMTSAKRLAFPSDYGTLFLEKKEDVQFIPQVSELVRDSTDRQ